MKGDKGQLQFIAIKLLLSFFNFFFFFPKIITASLKQVCCRKNSEGKQETAAIASH